MTDVDGALVARIHRLEIRTELSDLVARYGHLLDARDWDGITTCFTREGTLSFHGGSVTGRAALRDFYAEKVGAYEFTFHYPHSQVVEITGDLTATGVVSAHAEHGVDGTCLLAGVHYHDDYLHEDGRWRIARREIRSRYFLPWPGLGTDFHPS
ncbi:nuclear transport factor 2 family protein [Streptosporangium sp. NBC_01756]|uniref:nuclear transport factor 2 family protein n=1 Tax=Streptosporangium sp. NBC_01756 TaxID=2975950 RepID=UPI002DDB2772|nr:nuclear transport factor 2 family protein [Streptosporangium sp. NBC_01756]WSC83252.1 nuclear transport factor 2 family protein [Streptosporangium sp. NBC_01756]